jgi:hypothetical protein
VERPNISAASVLVAPATIIDLALFAPWIMATFWLSVFDVL